MENKCNKTPNNNKYLDHVYCQDSKNNNNYIRANHNNNNNNNINNASGGGSAGGTSIVNGDVLALLKENKQLKTMLILHLDLIQEQNDQLLAKDKQLIAQQESCDAARTRSAQLEAQVAELQKQLQRQIKRAAAAAGERSSLPPPPLAKIQCKAAAAASSSAIVAPTTGGGGDSEPTSVIGECNGKLISKIILHRVTLPGRGGGGDGTCSSSPNSTSASESANSEADEHKNVLEDCELMEIVDFHGDGEDEDAEATHEEEDDEEDDEDEEEEEDAGHTTEDSNEVIAVHSKRLRLRPLASTAMTPTPSTPTLPRGGGGAKPRRPLAATTPPNSISSVVASSSTTPLQVCVTPPTPSRGKQMPLMLWHAPDMHESDESGSCDSMADAEQRSTSVSSPAPLKLVVTGDAKKTKISSTHLAPPQSAESSTQQNNHPQQHSSGKPLRRRCPHISTTQMYCTREWEDDDFHCDYEFIKEEANALNADAPMLEIPKWTEHELSPLYCIEGTEDLCDDTFHKRHAKLEVDEKRRKKWDVQQIREQRRIEKLKRRHCKDELQAATTEQQPLLSFYPLPEAVQTICFVHDLPVQAFGEMIPKLSAHAPEFALPWLEVTTAPAATATTIFSSSSSVATLASGNLSATSAQAQQQMLNSSFVFLKKRKRQQSSSAAVAAAAATASVNQHAPTARQRITAKAAAAAVLAAATTVTTAAAQLTQSPVAVAPPLITTTPTSSLIVEVIPK